MAFGRRRAQAQEELRTALLDATARLESRSRADAERYQQTQLALLETLEGLRGQLVGRDTEMLRALGQLSDVCGAMEQRMELERAERRELVNVLSNVARAVARQHSGGQVSEITASKSHVIGGTIYGDAEFVTELEDDIDDFDDIEPGPGTHEVDLSEVDELDVTTVLAARHASGSLSAVVEVRCRFGDRWVDGFEVCDVVAHGGDLRYRLRRRSDGSVLPRLFSAEELRAVSPAPDATVPRERRGGWSELSR
jgi:hypothetical protein